MNLFAEFQNRIAAILTGLADEGRLPPELDLSRFVVEPPRDAAPRRSRDQRRHGLRPGGKAPFRQSARSWRPRSPYALARDPDVEAAEVAGPGFINIRLKRAVFAQGPGRRDRGGREFGRPAERPGEPVNVEYVSANPTGPMHVGHGRGAVFGDALANLLAFVRLSR